MWMSVWVWLMGKISRRVPVKPEHKSPHFKAQSRSRPTLCGSLLWALGSALQGHTSALGLLFLSSFSWLVASVCGCGLLQACFLPIGSWESSNLLRFVLSLLVQVGGFHSSIILQNLAGLPCVSWVFTLLDKRSLHKSFLVPFPLL